MDGIKNYKSKSLGTLLIALCAIASEPANARAVAKAAPAPAAPASLSFTPTDAQRLACQQSVLDSLQRDFPVTKVDVDHAEKCKNTYNDPADRVEISMMEGEAATQVSTCWAAYAKSQWEIGLHFTGDRLDLQSGTLAAARYNTCLKEKQLEAMNCAKQPPVGGGRGNVAADMNCDARLYEDLANLRSAEVREAHDIAEWAQSATANIQQVMGRTSFVDPKVAGQELNNALRMMTETRDQARAVADSANASALSISKLSGAARALGVGMGPAGAPVPGTLGVNTNSDVTGGGNQNPPRNSDSNYVPPPQAAAAPPAAGSGGGSGSGSPASSAASRLADMNQAYPSNGAGSATRVASSGANTQGTSSSGGANDNGSGSYGAVIASAAAGGAKSGPAAAGHTAGVGSSGGNATTSSDLGILGNTGLGYLYNMASAAFANATGGGGNANLASGSAASSGCSGESCGDASAASQAHNGGSGSGSASGGGQGGGAGYGSSASSDGASDDKKGKGTSGPSDSGKAAQQDAKADEKPYGAQPVDNSARDFEKLDALFDSIAGKQKTDIKAGSGAGGAQEKLMASTGPIDPEVLVEAAEEAVVGSNEAPKGKAAIVVAQVRARNGETEVQFDGDLGLDTSLFQRVSDMYTRAIKSDRVRGPHWDRAVEHLASAAGE